MTITYIKTELAPADNQLAAYLYFTSDTPVSYSYTVTKRTTSPTGVDFTYTSDLIYGVTQTIKIPVIGLYAQYANSVQVVFKDDTGTEVFNQPFIISTEDQEYDTSVIFHLDIEQTDPALYTSVWGNSWLMESLAEVMTKMVTCVLTSYRFIISNRCGSTMATSIPAATKIWRGTAVAFSKLISWAMSSLNSTCVMLMAITMQILMM